MTAYYRNRETGIVQAHPASGLGDFFNSDEIGEDGKPVKPFIPLGASADEAKRLLELASAGDTPEGEGDGDTAEPESEDTTTPDAKTGTGSAKTQKGS